MQRLSVPVPAPRRTWVASDGTVLDRAPRPSFLDATVALFWGVLAFVADFFSSMFSVRVLECSRGGVSDAECARAAA